MAERIHRKAINSNLKPHIITESCSCCHDEMEVPFDVTAREQVDEVDDTQC